MYLQTNIFPVKSEKLLHLLTQRLSFNHIFKESQLMAGMNSHLEIKLAHLLELDLLKGQTKQNALSLIEKINFLHYEKVFLNGREEEIVRLQYQNNKRIILVTGIHKQQISKLVDKFSENYIKYQNQFGFQLPIASVSSYNGFWVTIQTIHEQIAQQLTVFLRGRKKTMESGYESSTFKIENRRIRIILLSEDLFSLFVDSMTQLKAEQFIKSINSDGNGRRGRQKTSQGLKSERKCISYRAMPVARNPNYATTYNQTNQQHNSLIFYQGNFMLSNYVNKTSTSNKRFIVKTEKAIQTDFWEEKQQDRISELSNSKNGESVHTRQETEKEQSKMREEYLSEQETSLLMLKCETDRKEDCNFSVNQSQQCDQLSQSSSSSASPPQAQHATTGQQSSCRKLGCQTIL